MVHKKYYIWLFTTYYNKFGLSAINIYLYQLINGIVVLIKKLLKILLIINKRLVEKRHLNELIDTKNI